jgi:hypothetical protein
LEPWSPCHPQSHFRGAFAAPLLEPETEAALFGTSRSSAMNGLRLKRRGGLPPASIQLYFSTFLQQLSDGLGVVFEHIPHRIAQRADGVGKHSQ